MRRPTNNRSRLGYAALAGAAVVGAFMLRNSGTQEAPAKRGASAATERASVSAQGHAGAIEVFFSDAYANDPSVGQRDTANIDRRLAAFMASARTTLDCAFFELESERLAAALIDAKRRGVEVRIVADADYQNDAEMQEVLAAGIPVVFDGRSAFMHNKFVVADGEAVWTGSFNATDNCSFRNNNNGLLIRSSQLAQNYAAEFAEMFEQHSFGPRSPAATPNPHVSLAGAELFNYFAPEDDVPPKIIHYLDDAKRSIHFMAFSFTDSTIGNAMIRSQQRGVAVEGVIETRNAGSKGSQRDHLAASGIPVLADGNNYVMHHKVIVIDGTWTITGSYNFTGSAAHDNDENVLVIENAEVARMFEQEYQRVKRMAAGARPAM